MALTDTDYMTAIIARTGFPLARGVDLAPLMAELLARGRVLPRQRGRSMHLAAFAAGSLGESGIVGAGMPLAVRRRMSARLRGTIKVLCASSRRAATADLFMNR